MTNKNLTRATAALPWRRRAGRRALVTATMLVCLAAESHAQGNSPEAVELTAGQPHLQILGAEDEWTLAFDAGAGGTYILEIEQGGLDFVATVNAPDGSSQAYDSPLLRDESELIVLDAPSGGRFLIRIASHEYTGAKARLSALVTGADDVDPSRLEVLRLAAAASAANHNGTMDGWNDALAAFEALLSVVPPSSADRLAARGLFSMATIEYWQMGRWRRAAELAGEAAAIYTSAGLPRLAASANQLRAAALIEETTEIEKSAGGEIAREALALFEQAESLFQQAREAQLQLSARYDAALSANYLGMTFYYMGDWERATPWFRRAAEEYRTLDEWSGELQSLGNLAVVDFERGQLLSAIETFERILEILPENKSQRYRADTLDNLAASLLALGRLEEALKTFSDALAIHEAIDDQKGRGRSLGGIGVSYFNIGEQELALEHLQSALVARRAANDGRGQVSVLNFLGNIHRQRETVNLAIAAHSEAMHLATAPIDQARAQVNLGLDQVAAGNPADALGVLAEARRIALATGNRKLLADASQAEGEARLSSSQFDASLTVFREALEAYRAMALGAEEASALFGLARALRAQGQLEPSARQAVEVIEHVENLRSELIDPEFRAFFFSTRQRYFDFAVDVLMELQAQTTDGSDRYLREALAVSERSRARALVDLVAESSVSRSDSGFDEQSQRLYQRLSEARYRLNKVVADESTEKGDRGTSLADVQRELALLENEINLLQIRRRETDPALANLTDPEIVDAGQIQQMLDDGVALLQFDLGADRSYVWKVTRETIMGWALPGRGVIEDEARSLYGLLQTPDHAATRREALASRIDRLSSLLLGPVGPIEEHKIVVAADGVLQYLPFSLMQGTGEPARLLERSEIVYVPSLSVLAAQRTQHTGAAAAGGTIAIFADPVLELSDARLAGAVRAGAGDRMAGEPEFPPAAIHHDPLPRLPATRQEALAIAELVPADHSLLAMGFDATKRAVFESGLQAYRLVHFATHGLIDSRYPALSSLVFSQFDVDGHPQDGYLRLPDVYRLRLNADLVTLSACSTALGREVAGEGLTGLTRGLMYSGSRRVLASLWQVPDRATAELMKRFYQNMLDLDQRPAEALRNAQLDLSEQPRWRDPYFWGAFVLQGEWR